MEKILMNLVRVYYHNVWEPIYPFNQSDPSKAYTESGPIAMNVSSPICMTVFSPIGNFYDIKSFIPFVRPS